MNRNELEKYILETYNSEFDYPWLNNPNYEVFRHSNDKKWFALIMDVPKRRLGLIGNDVIDVVNLKCDPILIGNLQNEKGFFPAYHMNKEHWITVALDGSVSDEQIKMLVDMSFDLTSLKRKNCR